jgi:hypothetical protein
MAAFVGLRIGPLAGPPPIPRRLPGKRWSNWALHGIVWHCAERWVGPGKRKRDVVGNATLFVMVSGADGLGAMEAVYARMECTLRKGSKQHPGMTPKNVLNYTGRKLAWYLSMALSYGHIVKGHRVPIKGIWIIHEPSNTKTWLPATPVRRPTP